MSTQTSHTITNMGFQLKSSTCNFTVIKLLSNDLHVIDKQLSDLAQQTPHFFDHTPVIIDLHTLESQRMVINLNDLCQQLKQHSLIPLGVRCSNATNRDIAQTENIPILHEHKMTDHPPTPTQTIVKSATTLVTTPIRSGKQVYAKGGDLIVTAPVSPGAELLADGNIHVYNTLRGRALAGIQGDKSASVFCHKLDAELVAIAGCYLVFEDLPKTKYESTVRIYLQDEQLQIESL